MPWEGAGPPTPKSDDGPEESQLVLRAKDGDERAFGILVDAHGSVLIGVAHRMLGDRAEAEDVVQEAFFKAWQRLSQFDGRSAFRTWMYRIVINCCLNALRRVRPSLVLDVLPEQPTPARHGSPERSAEANAALRALTETLQELPADQRACWVLREWQDLSYEEIADVVGVSREAVRGRIFRARRYLTEAMSAWR
ncbi:RNA polymerase sigma factor [Streptomyces sp. NPDC058045]|uniref:RNA polymerase sigma factor n=1 Tax=Streptomyces sp. NPDC058045 TaxID=3346311 RepID=UPI0036EC9C3F